MSTLQAPKETPTLDTLLPARHPWRRALLLFTLLLLSVGFYAVLVSVAPKGDDRLSGIVPFLHVWMLCFLPYSLACALVLATKPPVGRWRRTELGIIFLGAMILRIMLLPTLPGLSRDAWRYLWDARVILHGYSPYVYAPWDKALVALRDTLILGNSRFRNVPTIYPPGAELVYALSYLLAPSNLFALKSIFVAFDMITCGALALLLARRGLDPRRVILYAWCPLPIVEFALQGHVDVITVMFTVLAVLAATSSRPGERVLTGILIGLGTLTKLYPILLLLVLLRRQRRDLALVCACGGTVLLGYLPFLILGHGQVLGFFFTYASEQGLNAGVTQQMVHRIGIQRGLAPAAILLLERIVDVVLLASVSLVVFVLRQRERLSVEVATLVLIGTFLSISSHVFPWYTTALLPWVAMLVAPLRTREGLSGKGMAIAAAWYFPCASLLGYFFTYTGDWRVYYALVYGILMAGLALAAIAGMTRYLSLVKKRGVVREKG
jgi:Glycosyltransferase family 87